MRKNNNLMLIGILLSLIFIVIGTVWLSDSAETLDKIAEHFGVEAVPPIWNPPISDYEISGYEGNIPMNIIVGIIFTLVVFVATIFVGKTIKKENEAAE